MNEKGYTIKELLVVLLVVFSVVLVAACVFPLAMWTDSNLEFWFSHFKGAPVQVPYWMSLIITVVLNGVAIAGNIIAELAKLLI